MSYPPPPWHTHGRAFVQPFLVDARSLALPPGFDPVSIAGRAVGMLGFIEYTAPSPLAYGELVWMPCMVRITSEGRHHRGYYVDKMYVDDDASLEAGRTEWALPKQKARFEVIHSSGVAARVTVDTEDGAHLVLDVRARGPSLSTPVGSSTLQDAGDHVVRFHGSGKAQLSSGAITIAEARGVDAWTGFLGARRLPGAGAAMRDFAITMHAPRRIEHALH